MADKRPPKIGEFQERYTGKKTLSGYLMHIYKVVKAIMQKN